MAKIKVRFGASEIEVDSRDFYVDNESIGEVIESVAKSMQENRKKPPAIPPKPDSSEATIEVLNTLDDAEAFESEFSEPRPISISEVRDKLKVLESESFFSTPRTVSETVEQLREHGWAASLLDVSKVLAKMSFSKEISRSSQDHRNYYCAQTISVPT